MKNTEKVKRILRHAALLLVLYVLQQFVFARLPILGVCPTILPIAVAGIAMFEGQEYGIGFGVAAGLLNDVSLGTFPEFAIAFVIVGFGVGILFETIMTKSVLSYILISFAVLIFTATLQFFGLLVFYDEPFFSLLIVAVKQVLYSVLFIIPLYFATSQTARR